MAYITLELAKKHLNLEDSFKEDDEYILGLIAVSEDTVEMHVNRDLEELAEKNGGCLPAPILQAMLLYIEHLYQNRGVVGTHTDNLSRSYDYLIDLYRNYN